MGALSPWGERCSEGIDILSKAVAKTLNLKVLKLARNVSILMF